MNLVKPGVIRTMLDERNPAPETETCRQCQGTGRSGPGRTTCLRCRGAGKLTKAQLVIADMCSKMLEDLR